MLHGRGSQYNLTMEWMKLRDEGLDDPKNLTDEQLAKIELEGSEGGGMWRDNVYIRYSNPILGSKFKKKVDRRDVYAQLGEKTRENKEN